MKQGRTLGRRPAGLLFDEEDRALIESRSWSLTADGYAHAAYRENGRLVTVYLHRLLMKPPSGVLVDHINGNRLDNRRGNLRLVDAMGNSENQGGWRNSTSRFRGVCWDTRYRKWHAYARGRTIGRFDSEQEAAAAARAVRLATMPAAVDR